MILYRVVRTNPPTSADFRSHEARGRPLLAGASEVIRRLWSGVSVYDSAGRARQVASDYPRLGTWIAELGIPDGGAIRVERTTNSLGHYTLWDEEATIIARVVAVRPIAAVG